MSDQQEKVALSETTRAFVTPMVAGVAAGSVAYGLPAALDKVRDVRIRRNRDKYITAMKDVHPDLRGMNKKDLHIAYNSLAMHSPHVLRDPLLGGQELLRMSKYRQADVNSLNEINKLRGNSMREQGCMNATNFVAGGITEGFKGYQAQRQADSDQAYREKMDKMRTQMDKARFDLERDRFSYTQDRDVVRDTQFGTQQQYRESRDKVQDAYRKDRDATLDAQFQTQQAYRASRDAVSDRQSDRQFNLSNRKNNRDQAVHQAWVDEGSPGPMAIKKAASAHHLTDIVARLRDRNL
jgi:hypothetical protein